MAHRRRRPLIVTGLLAGLAALCLLVPRPIAEATTVQAGDRLQPPRGPAIAGEVIVRFERGASKPERRAARQEVGAEFEQKLVLPRAELVAVDGPVGAAVRRLERQAEVAYAQPNYRYEATAVDPPDDTFFGQLWGLSDPAMPDPGVSALEAWEETEGDGQVIAVVDTGVDLTHPDLAPNLWTNPLEDLGLDGVDDDLNSRVDDVHGFDFVDVDGDPDDYEFHGTHVAGTAAAVAGNDLGIAGVAPAAEIMAVRVLDGDGSGSTADIANGIVYAAENGADVVNLSLGGPAGGDEAMEDAVELAGSEDVVVVAAAGNEGANNDTEPHTPCALPQANLICVAAVTQAGGLAGFSNYGATSVDIAAPGTNILSARVDYGAPQFFNGLEVGETAAWETATANGGVAWGISSKTSGGKAATGNQSATDSPGGTYGQADNPALFEGFAISELRTDAPVDLTGERGCRLHFRAMYETEAFFDFLGAGGFEEGGDEDFSFFTGTSSGYPTVFSREEASISDLDDQADVHPAFAIFSDSEIERDGAYVDDVRVICRDETYVDAIASGAESDLPNAGNYIHFQGTSMATPHVAGVVALVRAAAPGLSDVQIIDAILAGASAIPSPDPSRQTRTEGIADACQAIALATGADVEAECPGSSANVPPPGEPPPGESEPPQIAGTPAPIPQPQPPADTRRPLTFFDKHPATRIRTRGRFARVVFEFGSNETGVSFLCRIDRSPFRPCRARVARRVRPGRHVLRVFAVDAAGNADATPAVFRFRVQRVG